MCERMGGCGWFVSALHVMDYSDQWKVDQSADWLDKFRRCNRTNRHVSSRHFSRSFVYFSPQVLSLFPFLLPPSPLLSLSFSFSFYLYFYLSFPQRSSFIYSCQPYHPRHALPGQPFSRVKNEQQKSRVTREKKLRSRPRAEIFSSVNSFPPSLFRPYKWNLEIAWVLTVAFGREIENDHQHCSVFWSAFLPSFGFSNF